MGNEKETKLKIIGWALQVTWSDGRDETITEIDDVTASAVDTFLTEYYEDKEKSKHE
mgnify:CR=1 FL=1